MKITQLIKFPLLLILAVFVFIVDLYASIEIKEQDDVPKFVLDGSEIVYILMDADRVVIKDFEKDGYEITDKKWITEFLSILSSARAEMDDMCFCLSFPSFTFYKGDEYLLELSTAHAVKIKLNAGYLSGEYIVGKRLVDRIDRHAQEKMKEIDLIYKELDDFEL